MRIIVFTGAGVSRESGLLTFRDSKDGLWEGHNVNEVASIQGWWENPAKVLDFYNKRRRDVLAAVPNRGHEAIARLEKHHELTIITQNVDDLHERAGSKDVIHLHGSVLRSHPVDDPEASIPWTSDLVLGDVDANGVQYRPSVVWFGEGLPEWERAISAALSPDVDVLIVCGTSLTVYPAAMIATETQAKRIYVIDPAPPELDLPGLVLVRQAASTGLEQVVAELIG